MSDWPPAGYDAVNDYNVSQPKADTKPWPPPGYTTGETIKATPPEKYQQIPTAQGMAGGTPFGYALANRQDAIDQALKEGNIKDLLGNISAAAFHGGAEPILEGGLGAEGLSGGIGAGRALMSGAARPALGLAAGAAGFGLANKAGEELDLPWYARYPLAYLAAKKAGGLISPETFEGTTSLKSLAKKIFEGKSSEFEPLKVNPRILAKMRYGGPNRTEE